MIRIIDYSEIAPGELERFTQLKRNAEIESAVYKIIEQIKLRGDDALLEYAKRFDGANIESLRVTQAELDEAEKALDTDILRIMEKAAENIANFHSRQMRQGYAVTNVQGIVVGQRVTAIGRVGIYVPGGTANYPSTVLMNVIPAKIAGVKKLILCTPPRRDGSVAPEILACAKIAGVDEVFKAGGAQAVAAMAYGTATIPRVYKIVGPGNAYVAAAKRMVFGQVGVDMIAGPSDILIIADAQASERFIADDMIAQAEHDENASAVLVTDSRKLAEDASRLIEKRLPTLPRRHTARASIDRNGMIIIVNDLDEAVLVSNIIAPEHLEILTCDPFAVLGGITNAGSIFLGQYSPEALGDYYAGPNHTIPTMGTAKFSSPLSVDDFVKKSSYTYYDARALDGVCADIAAFARSEGLEGHARSIEARFEVSK